MRTNKLRNLIVIIFITFGITFTLIYINNFTNEKKLNNRLIELINNNYNKNNKYKFSMNEVTDFKWNKMLIYQVGSSNKEISELLGVNFNDSIDLASCILGGRYR